jgi:hypothetical protein|tara:strand:+ start:180 stop:434 length:255 start_codon:yes stop_codon:yes gene_type:complete
MEKKMYLKLILTTIAVLFLSISSAFADVWVNGYHKSNGTWVNGYWKTSPNYTYQDNYSTWGNTNPYTGEKGYNYKSCGLYSLGC